MTTKKHSVEQEAKDCIDEEMKFQRVPEVSSCVVERSKYKNGKKIPKVRSNSSSNRIDDHLKNQITGLDSEKNKKEDGFSVNGIFRFVAKKVSDGFQSSSFIVKF